MYYIVACLLHSPDFVTLAALRPVLYKLSKWLVLPNLVTDICHISKYGMGGENFTQQATSQTSTHLVSDLEVAQQSSFARPPEFPWLHHWYGLFTKHLP